MKLNDFLKMVDWKQSEALKEMPTPEKEALLKDYGDYIYQHEMNQSELGTRPDPDRGEIEDYRDEMKNQGDPYLARLEHYQNIVNSPTFQDDTLEEIQEVLTERGADGIPHIVDYNVDKGRKAFGIAEEILKEAEEEGLDEVSKYEAMRMAYSLMNTNKTGEQILQKTLDKLRDYTARNAQIKDPFDIYAHKFR